MIIIMKATATTTDITDLKDRLESRGLRAVVMQGQEKTAVGVIGETRLHLPADQILALPSVESIRRVSDPCKLANRLFHPEDTIVKAGSAKVGGGHFAMIAGPCSIESEEQIVGIAKAVKVAGATMLRGGAFKPRTSPYDFQGLRSEGLDLLLKARKATGLPIVTEIMSITHLPLFEDVDVIQVGARSMQNFEMLKELGRTNKPILLKRGLANTIKELLMAAEYIMASGNDQIILCERGIRTYETATRNTLDLSAVPVLHEKTHLPVVIDPSHATGVAPLCSVHGSRSSGLRRRRSDDRSAQQPRRRALRRSAVDHARRIRARREDCERRARRCESSQHGRPFRRPYG